MRICCVTVKLKTAMFYWRVVKTQVTAYYSSFILLLFQATVIAVVTCITCNCFEFCRCVTFHWLDFVETCRNSGHITCIIGFIFRSANMCKPFIAFQICALVNVRIEFHLTISESSCNVLISNSSICSNYK